MVAVITIILGAAILTETMCELWVKALPLQFIKEYLKTTFHENDAVSEFIDCKYCQSVWLGWLNAYILGLSIWDSPFIDGDIAKYIIIFFFGGLIAHRLSNYLHAAFDLVYYRGRAHYEFDD